MRPSRTSVFSSLNKLSWWKIACAACVFCLAAVALPAQTFTTVANFDNADGAYPYLMSLVQGTDGNFYGTTSDGGASGYGTVFKMTPKGALTVLHSFDDTDGSYPYAGLVLTTGGNFYGTTSQGGTDGYGTVFEITAAGKLTTLHSFDGSEGACPYSTLVQGTNGNLYGTTANGGAGGACVSGCGTVFEITATGKLTTLHSFDASDGAAPVSALIQATNGNFYGTTVAYGAHDGGTLFEITPAGKLTTIYDFCSQSNCTDGYGPYGGLVQAANGNFYGTTVYGGAHDTGTVFEITAAGKLTTLYSFCVETNCEDGAWPYAGLVQGTDGNFYGATLHGGTVNTNAGTVFKITSGGTHTTVHNFCSEPGCDDGYYPYGGLIQATNGSFYGTTQFGGASDKCANGCGVVFGLAVGLGPFVKTDPTSGIVGAAVTILGNNLTGATSVTFNGTAAAFKVVSSTEITTTVPKGASTGIVKVKTPSGTLTSNVSFRVP
jgi:uncharacterized repeat protein (TIGR03803 family)